MTWSKGGTEWEVEIWDTAGQEALKSLRLIAYPGTNVFLMTYDMTNADSLENVLDVWIAEVEDGCPDYWGLILVGTKQDLYEERQACGEEDDLVDLDRVAEVCIPCLYGSPSMQAPGLQSG